ncbi:MAG: hypothetical protein QXO15_04585 [Nitrososphaerota archaeon]
MSKEIITRFLEAIKDPEKLLKYCKKFHEEEPRNIAYVYFKEYYI